PKKLLVYGSKFAEEFEDAAGFGWTVDGVRLDWSTLITNVAKEVDRLNTIYARNLEVAGADMFLSRAEITGPHGIRLADGRSFRVGTILVATGATPVLDATVEGIDHAITSNEVFHLPEMPRRIAIVGAGYIALEFAGVFNGLGAETTVIYRGSE